MTSTEPSTPPADLDEPATPARSIARAAFTVTVDEQTSYVVSIRTADYVAWDRTSARHKWGTSQDSPFLFSSFLAYSAAKRAGHVPPGQTFDAFCDTVEDVHPYRGEAGDDVARPTRRAPSPA